jgi:hypothetical protein
MMNGFGLSVRDALSDAAVEGFVGGLNAMQAAIEHSMQWRGERIALALGEHEGDPTLVELFSRAEAAWTKLEAFNAMVEWWKRGGTESLECRGSLPRGEGGIAPKAVTVPARARRDDSPPTLRGGAESASGPA